MKAILLQRSSKSICYLSSHRTGISLCHLVGSQTSRCLSASQAILHLRWISHASAAVKSGRFYSRMQAPSITKIHKALKNCNLSSSSMIPMSKLSPRHSVVILSDTLIRLSIGTCVMSLGKQNGGTVLAHDRQSEK